MTVDQTNRPAGQYGVNPPLMMRAWAKKQG